MSRLQVTLVLTGVIALLSVPPAMGKVDVLKLARRAFTIAERADKATRKPIQTSQVSDGAVTSAKLQDGGVQAADLADGSVTSGKLHDGDVQGADLADGAVTSEKLHDGEVHTTDLAEAAVTAGKLAARRGRDRDAGRRRRDRRQARRRRRRDRRRSTTAA